MVVVALKDSGKIVNRIDAWEQDAERKMRKWITDKGYVLLDAEITMMGDMILWVA